MEPTLCKFLLFLQLDRLARDKRDESTIPFVDLDEELVLYRFGLDEPLQALLQHSPRNRPDLLHLGRLCFHRPSVSVRPKT